jgi:hypothetical protein
LPLIQEKRYIRVLAKMQGQALEAGLRNLLQTLEVAGRANEAAGRENEIARRASLAARHIQGADDKLGQFLSQDIWATANHRNCLQHSLESCPSLL